MPSCTLSGMKAHGPNKSSIHLLIDFDFMNVECSLDIACTTYVLMHLCGSDVIMLVIMLFHPHISRQDASKDYYILVTAGENAKSLSKLLGQGLFVRMPLKGGRFSCTSKDLLPSRS